MAKAGHRRRHLLYYQFDFPELGQTHVLIGLPAAISKTVADCEVLYIPVFLARAKMAEGFLL